MSRTALKILLVGNYPTDQQESMLRFAQLLLNGLSGSGVEVRLIRPEPVIGRLKRAPAGIGKWLGYLDKFFLFPRQLRRLVKWADLVHICDHSNAIYTAYVKDRPSLITCHDLIAIRGGFGEDTASRVSYTGRILQRWIFAGLKEATWIACDSTYTRNDLHRLTNDDRFSRSSLLLLGLNQPYRQLAKDEVARRLQGLPGLDGKAPFLLCVGRNQRRKNRDGMMRAFQHLQGRWHGKLVIAGEPLDDDLARLKSSLGLDDEHVVQIIKPSDEVLEALYNKAHALLFLSHFEGFGWPVVEAQACGCPVICSDRSSLPEVAGDGALICPLDDLEATAQAVISLDDAETRTEMIRRGLQNVERFRSQRMIDDYIALYRRLLQGHKAMEPSGGLAVSN